MPPSATPAAGAAGLDAGVHIDAGDPALDQALVAIRDAAQVSAHPAAAGWLVPAGQGGDMDLVAGLAATGKLLMVAVNGLGPGALSTIHAAAGDATLVHLFDARDQDQISYLEQLSWLQAQNHALAVMAGSQEKLLFAAAAAPHSVVLTAPEDVDFSSLWRIAAAGGAGSPRPFSAAEVDHLLGAEASLSVVRALGADEIIGVEDLTVAVTENRGLSPALRDKVAGRRLRYGIKPGEPLNFGHLMDEHDHE